MDHFVISHKLSFSKVLDILIIAIDSPLFFDLVEWNMPKDFNHKNLPWLKNPDFWDNLPIKFYFAPFLEKGSLSFRERDSENIFVLNLESIKRGLELMAEKCPIYFSDILMNNDDASTADAFLQCCFFGEMLYV